jgi:nucleoside-diphosphate-sugar epimerase
MRVLVTGGNGFIGRHVISELVRRNIEYIVVGRRKNSNIEGISIEANLLEKETHNEIIKRTKPTHLIHLAWDTEHGKYWNSTNNLRWQESTANLVESFCKAGGKYVSIAGTSAEYDWTKGYLYEDCSEIKPATLYGASKDATRRLISSVCEIYNTPFSWARVFIPYGQGEDQRRLIPSLHRVFQGKQSPFGVNAENYRDFIHVEDVASAFIHLVTNQINGIYNISSGEPTWILDVVRNIASKYSEDPNLILNLPSERPDECEIIVGNNEKLKSLGWTQKHSPLCGILYEV